MRLLAAVLLALGVVATPAYARDAPIATRFALVHQRLSIAPVGHAGHLHRFRVEVARSDAEQEQGLMFRRHLAPDAGMIFPFAAPRIATFWMKNTLIPLDLVFYRADGTIARIAVNATPMSLDVISSGEPVIGVLELAGGRTAQLGIVAGDRVATRR